ncbi:hypothetical protein DAPPUDRAFT_316208 [Daphnia pulex]|uniref:CUB domain-containing protein n=1 Tax=Daphnia pulex TaxID=6669 RepID=E9GC60_DAPPU|nr:hypothetical protein DAPPUDRAFT_316208 [Daphnia pulex]|eukprot:EFX82920.1 hypothetical protein DAPPUDRAFT_316208 [Daphnia pulex]
MLTNKILESSLLLVICFLRFGRADTAIVVEASDDESKDSIVVEDVPQYGYPTTPWLPYYFFSPMMQPQYSSVGTSPNKETGICEESGTCTRLGGRASGSCANGRVCCINIVTNTCDETDRKVITVDNTYWQSPTTGINSFVSSCGITVKLDAKLPEQGKAVCQVRFNFVLFTIAQPDTESACITDTFDVAGASNRVPTICGDNEGQHMYLNVPSSSTSPTDLQFSFNFGTNSNPVRAWNILISMIPCDSANLAPMDCLQYFTGRTGTVKSFNWRDVTGTATRQLANQDYSICFRTAPGFAKTLCVTPCTVTSTQKPFSLSVARFVQPPDGNVVQTPDVSQFLSTNCNNDFLVIPGAYNTGNPPIETDMTFDRFCGERLNALPGKGVSTTVCTTATPFRLLYRTNSDETLTETIDTDPNVVAVPIDGNRGFCLNFRNQ